MGHYPHTCMALVKHGETEIRHLPVCLVEHHGGKARRLRLVLTSLSLLTVLKRHTRRMECTFPAHTTASRAQRSRNFCLVNRELQRQLTGQIMPLEAIAPDVFYEQGQGEEQWETLLWQMAIRRNYWLAAPSWLPPAREIHPCTSLCHLTGTMTLSWGLVRHLLGGKCLQQSGMSWVYCWFLLPRSSAGSAFVVVAPFPGCHATGCCSAVEGRNRMLDT